ncbi:penicillin-binding protein activator LpoB [Prolixibacter denitrificans]|uniref:Penicillin-binding protein activator LpoB n=1 Tax=Prolixibacter denitrificans TaxID=1541063 RepID=A0A2P8C8E0_9BACT|nr:penicillin-binding protein activator LpoB [Prolixibacter denitrificans]PSK81231.1 hypothetical protein CLV93_11015 [Prolixibacter denitrificans]GET21684.1 hypothetical protein JCM18694_19300 [Prolixibacter denitrificans]
MKRQMRLFALIAFALILGSCSRQVTRVATDQAIDLSGRWNDTDSRLTAQALTEQVLNQRWLEDFERTHGRKPVVVVGLVYNKSHEHIDTDTYIKDIERSFINSGKVRLVQAGAKRDELRAERQDQNTYASPSTAAQWARELGADFIMQGDISSIVDSYKREKVVYYQVNEELTNLETNEVVWMGEKKIKKAIRN